MDLDEYIADIEGGSSDIQRETLDAARARFRLASELLDCRASRGLSQRDLERLSGVQQGEISRIEAGLANPTVRTLQSLGTALGLELSFATVTDPR